ncbi:hypothetical protein TNCV_4617341 [Trichonephila clavipes]|nr:hypothetical protein TNCV_4617341 [Trichonephila clavipes]
MRQVRDLSQFSSGTSRAGNSVRDYDEEESNDEEYNSKHDSSTEIYPDSEEGDTRAVKMDPGKRSKHSAVFKIKVIQFAKENGNRAAARMFDIGESSIRKWKKIK